jgi:hypothetical protein
MEVQVTCGPGPIDKANAGASATPGKGGACVVASSFTCSRDRRLAIFINLNGSWMCAAICMSLAAEDPQQASVDKL